MELFSCVAERILCMYSIVQDPRVSMPRHYHTCTYHLLFIMIIIIINNIIIIHSICIAVLILYYVCLKQQGVGTSGVPTLLRRTPPGYRSLAGCPCITSRTVWNLSPLFFFFLFFPSFFLYSFDLSQFSHFFSVPLGSTAGTLTTEVPA